MNHTTTCCRRRRRRSCRRGAPRACGDRRIQSHEGAERAVAEALVLAQIEKAQVVKRALGGRFSEGVDAVVVEARLVERERGEAARQLRRKLGEHVRLEGLAADGEDLELLEAAAVERLERLAILSLYIASSECFARGLGPRWVSAGGAPSARPPPPRAARRCPP